MGSEHHFQVDLRGMIDLLSDHLYSGPQVYIRELLQNSVDAVTARKKIEPDYSASIRLEVIETDGSSPPTLVMTDDGIGLTEEEVHQFLSTIGKSTKRGIDRSDFIGQFGIGLLSAFVVCEQVVVITRSVKPDSPSIEWKARNDGTYTVRILEHQGEPGTQVYLRCKPGCHEFFEPEFIVNTAKHFGAHLPIPITISVGEDRTLINDTPPWRYEFASEQMQLERFLQYGEDVFGVRFLDAIPLSAPSGGVEGIAFVMPHSSSTATRRKHRVYLKNMLLSEDADNLLPDWAFFVKCVVNAKDLRPTAAREGFYEDQYLDATRDELGGCIRQYLVRLANEHRDRLNRIIDLHHLPIKGLAVEDDEFYEMFVNWLPFETSLGTMTLEEYRQNNEVVRYVSSRDQFRQVSSVAAAQDICLINGGYVYDDELLQKLPLVFPNQQIEKIDVSELTQEFTDITLEEREEVFDLIQVGNLVLQPYQCSVDVRKYEPANLPTLYTINEAGTFMRSIDQTKDMANDLWSGVLDSISESQVSIANAQLCLNYHNPLVRRLAGLKDRELLRRALEMLYVQALLLGHYPLKAAEMKLLSSGLLGLIEQAVDKQQEEESDE
ncbi:MAG: HSP90 family protein [Blastopirellula sp.]|nr:MAG: HSP90 family protein [Blastopirellula sp.]